MLLHGLLSNRDHNFAPALAEALSKATGSAVYRFDCRFSPEPEKEPEYRYRFSGFLDDVDDLLVVLRHLKADGYAPWCLVGHSRGANVALLAGADEEILNLFPNRRPLLCSLAARFTMPDMFRRIFSEEQQRAVDDPACGHEFVWESKRGSLVVLKADADVVREKMDMKSVVQKGIPADVPILHVHGQDDEVISIEDAKNFVPARKEAHPDCDAEMVVVEGSRHAFAGKKPSRTLIETVVAWVVKRAEVVGVPIKPWPMSPSDKGAKATAAAKTARADKFAAAAAAAKGGAGVASTTTTAGAGAVAAEAEAANGACDS